jgi:phosphatidylglycerophosphate synthase
MIIGGGASPVISSAVLSLVPKVLNMKGRSPRYRDHSRIGFIWVLRTPGEGIDAIVGAGCLGKRRQALEMLAIATLLLSLLLRIPSAGGGETELGLPQILLIAGVILLLLLLAGTVFWRVRRTPRKR